MQDFEALSIRWKHGQLEVLDQRTLPDKEVWLAANTPQDMHTYIKQLSVRGAPLIGVAAALSIVQYALREQRSEEEIISTANYLRSARPTAVNLMYACDEMIKNRGSITPQSLIKTAEAIISKEVAMCEQMSKLGASLVQDGERIMTICNTGALATPGQGTALGVIKHAHQQRKNIFVWVCETRPLLQGGRLTAWELDKAAIPYKIITDSMAASVMARKMVDRIFVGADRIAVNGDFANKIGTYSLAVLAHHHHIPFHPVAPLSTVDFDCASGQDIEIEMRGDEEVRGAHGVRWAPMNAPTYNPAFDVTPSALVESLVLDVGIIPQKELLSNSLLGFKAQQQL
jgi:methylthioribose-1-phosphate isomerase